MKNELLTRAKRLESFAALDTDNVALLRDLALTYHDAGEHTKALATLDRVTPEQQPFDAPLRSQLLLATGQWQAAIQLFKDALRQQADSAALWFNLGYAQWAAEDAEAAVDSLNRARQLDPSNVRARYYLALSLDHSSRLNEALQVLREAVEQNVCDTDLFTLQSQLELGAGHISEAQAAAERAIAQDPRSAAAWQAKGQVALFALDAPSASKSLRHSLDLDASDTDTEVLLAQAYMMLGRPHQARRMLAAMQTGGRATSNALCLLGWSCCAENDVISAKKAFSDALEMDADDADALAGLGCTLLAEGDLVAAQRASTHALAKDPDHVIAKLLANQCAAVINGTQASEAAIKNVLESLPFGPLNMTVQQALVSPQITHAARRLQRRSAKTSR